MVRWKSHLIEAYRFLSLPYRHFRLARMSRAGTVPVIVLFYHRVADDHLNPWTISRAEFQRQIDWFQQQFELVDLQECQRRIQSGNNSRPTLSITFDDGYGENCEFALPMLIERRIPVTYFVATGFVDQQKPFAHDVESGQPLAVNTIEALRALDLAGVEIASHTRNHRDLGRVDSDEELIDEVLASSRQLEHWIGREVRYFAFPFGQRENLNPRVFALLKQAGFLGACSAYGGWNKVGGDSFHLQRIHGDPSMVRMKNWLSFDPRIERIKGFDYSAAKFDPRLLDAALKEFDDGIFPVRHCSGDNLSNSQYTSF